jgi:chemotaxis protein methyltransferase CheR
MSLDPATFGYLRDLVRERSGIVLGDDKVYLIETRLSPLIRSQNIAGLPALAAALRGQPFGALHKAVIEAMTTNETFFFRDLHPFEALKKEVLPPLVAARRAGRRLSMWCAAASSGQEPYTIAMVLREHFPEVLAWTTQFVATDISAEMIARCRKGLYTQLEVNRGLPAPLLIKHFTKSEMDWQIKDELRRMVDFRELNLLDAWPFQPQSLDIVFCRNVLIYFDVETKKKILGRIRTLLRPDGALFLGGAETTLNLDDGFERAPYEKAGCYRLRKP